MTKLQGTYVLLGDLICSLGALCFLRTAEISDVISSLEAFEMFVLHLTLKEKPLPELTN